MGPVGDFLGQMQVSFTVPLVIVSTARIIASSFGGL